MSKQTLVEAALQILSAADPANKARLGEDAAAGWLGGDISLPYHPGLDLPVPDRPSRPAHVKLVAPQSMPKLGRAGSLQSRQAIVHSLVHTESWAIDLSWDIIARFGKVESMPNEFFTDFVKVALDEGRHFSLLAARLRELGSYYGALPAHDGLWDSAIATSGSLLARLAVEHCVHEARGLDVLPTTILRFRNGGDDSTADLLEKVVYPEEITHCAAGVKWFKYLCCRASLRSYTPASNATQELETKHEEKKPTGDHILSAQKTGDIWKAEQVHGEDLQSIIQTFHEIVRSSFRGPLKTPFNVEARNAAGFGLHWYEPLADKARLE